jgi:DNA-binding MarR family transcriptional regulator
VAKKAKDPAVGQIAAFIEYVSHLALSERVHQRVAGSARVTPSERAALRDIARHGPLSVAQLAERLRLDRTTVSRLASRLHELGLVSRTQDADDKRKVWLQVTPDGERMLASLGEVSHQYYDVATADWSPEDRAAIGELLARLQDCLLRLEFDTEGHATRVAPPREARIARSA